MMLIVNPVMTYLAQGIITVAAVFCVVGIIDEWRRGR